MHDDAKREYAYGPARRLPDTKVGTFPQSLMDEAKKGGWTVISMKNDWKRIFAFDDVRHDPLFWTRTRPQPTNEGEHDASIRTDFGILHCCASR